MNSRLKGKGNCPELEDGGENVQIQLDLGELGTGRKELNGRKSRHHEA